MPSGFLLIFEGLFSSELLLACINDISSHIAGLDILPLLSVNYLKYISKLEVRFVIFCHNFPNSSPIDVFSFEMDSQVYEDNFQLFPSANEANLGKEIDVGKFDVFSECTFMVNNLDIQNLHS